MKDLNILIVQYGNYAEAYHRFESGGAETYRDQRRSVDFVASLAKSTTVTTVAICQEEHDVELAPRLRSIGIPSERLNRSRIESIFNDIKPDTLICRTPHLGVLRLARKQGVKTLPCFADIFQTSGPKTMLRHFLLRLALSGSNVPCIANHSLNASRSVVSGLWYSRERVVPWDWSRTPISGSVKSSMQNSQTPRICFAGALVIDKGIGDCLVAIKTLHERGIHAFMTCAGPGDLDYWKAEAARLGVNSSVEFLGLIPNEQVREQMQAHDIVVVPSRHSYPEGLPNTIYEGLASRSALIISDHPAFQSRLIPEQDCLIFCASNPDSLADSIARLCADQGLYANLSSHASQALESLYVGLEWSDLVETFLNDPENSSGWVERNSLKALNF